jgi:hypothetical protein
MAKLAKEVGIIVEEPEIEVIIEGPDGDDDYETDDEMAEDTSVELAVPEGGIGGFAMSEADFAILEAEEAKKEFGEEGLAQFTAVAKKMAGHGRFGDDSVAHIQTGEMVVPLTLLESNPALKAQIFKSLRENGIEDPEQYVVGSNANSINPETGLMEFGFFSKLWKGIKKVVKAVVKVVKKIAPIVLPIALAFTPLGLIYGAALGSGIGTLINGGSIKDALKSALISGATGAVFQGFTGAGTFGENVKAGLVDPFGRISQTASGAVTSAGNVFGSEATKLANATGGVGGAAKQTFFSQYVPTAAVGAAGAAGPGAAGPVVPDAGAAGPVVPDAGAAPVVKTGDAVLGTNQAGATTGTSLSKSITLDKPPGFYESLKGALTPGDKIGFVEGMGNAFFPKSTSVTDVLGAEGITPVNATAAQLTGAEVTAKALSPGLFRSYAPLAALATTGAMAGGFFDVPEMEMPGLVQRQEDGTVTTGADLIAADPSKYLVADLGATRLNPETGEYEDVLDDELTIEAPDTSMYTVPTNYPLQQQVAMSENGYLMRSNPGGPFARPYVQGAAQGGPIFPRRNGGVAPTEGVQGQDSVRAMLMPGEFVMTTDAVRGLGNGNLNNGIKNMYSVMRNLERRGRATA